MEYVYIYIYIYIYINIYIYIWYIYIYIITGKEMKLDLDTQSFMQNTFTIFSARVRNIYLFWWQHFDIISNFLFNKLFSLFSNISSFSFKPREYLFDWGLYARNWFFTAHVGLEFPAFKFQYSTDSFVSFLYLLMLNDFLWCAYRSLNVFSLIPL